MGRWYDGCMGRVKSVNQMQSFTFGAPYLKNEPTSFNIKKGTNFNHRDITGKKIGQLHCMFRFVIFFNNKHYFRALPAM